MGCSIADFRRMQPWVLCADPVRGPFGMAGSGAAFGRQAGG